MKYAFIIGFVLMVVLQWYPPLSMIRDANKTLDGGVEFKFRTAPVDPSDPFRGKYVRLSFAAEAYHPLDTNEMHFDSQAQVWAVIEEDSAGYAKVAYISGERPESESNYIPAEFIYGMKYDSQVNIVLKFPFDRFYVEESKASDAEQVYWQSRMSQFDSDSVAVCYAKVMVMNGDAKLVDVIINDSSIVDVVRRMNADKNY